MSTTVEKLLNIARAEIGTKATAVKRCKYNKWFYGSDVSGSCYDWCAAFVCWCFAQAGASDLIPTKSAGCGYLAAGFNNKGRFSTKPADFKPGDIVFFHWSNAMSGSVPGAYTLDHVGIIEKVNADGTYTTIEGNTGNSAYGEVKRQIRSKSVISGVAKPAYTPSVQTTKEKPTITYCACVNGKWGNAVKGYSGNVGDGKNPITAIAIKVAEGAVRYRVHTTQGKWLNWITGYSTSDTTKYAGNGTPIDAIQVEYLTPDRIVKANGGYLKAKYKVAPIGKDYYSTQYDLEVSSKQDGYAGSFGKPVGRFMLTLD